jgi:hypothetical protein
MKNLSTALFSLLLFLSAFSPIISNGGSIKTEALTTSDCGCNNQELLNGSFETAKNNVPTDWKHEGKFITDTNYDVCGVDNGRLDGAGSFWQDVANVVPGSKVTLKIYGGYHKFADQYFRLIFLGKNDEELLHVYQKLNKPVSETGGRLTRYTLTGTAPAGTLKIRVKGTAARGDYFKVDVACLNIEKPVVSCSDCNNNRLQNPSFEETTMVYNKEVPTGWVGTNFVKDAAFVVCGSKNGLINAGAGSFYQDVKTTQGSKVKLKIWGGYHHLRNHRFELQFFAETGADPISSVFVELDKSVEDLKNKLKLYQLEGTAPAGTAYVRVKGSSTGDYFKVDGACLTIEESAECVACNGNKLVNSSFEQGTTGWVKENGNGSFSTADKYAVCGSQAGVISGFATASQDVQVTPGSDVTLSVWGAYSAKDEQKFSLIFYNAQNVQVGSESAAVDKGVTTGNTSGLKQYTVSKKAPAGTKFVRVQMSSQGSEFRFDNACLTIVAGSLPVKLADFKANIMEGAVQLEWSTTMESNSGVFEVQQSTAGKGWKVLGQVAAKGESNAVINYDFTDVTPAAGNNLYRLKMIDLDETFAYSSIVSVNVEGGAEVNVYPNPATEYITISTPGDALLNVAIFNANGQLVKRATTDKVDLSGLGMGRYIVKISHKSGAVTTKRIVVSK